MPVFLFSTERAEDDATAYSRMFAPGFGITEDAATGSASGPLGCYLVRHKLVAPEKAGSILSLQGVKMGRPSHIHVAIGLDGEEITTVRGGWGISRRGGGNALYLIGPSPSAISHQPQQAVSHQLLAVSHSGAHQPPAISREHPPKRVPTLIAEG